MQTGPLGNSCWVDCKKYVQDEVLAVRLSDSGESAWADSISIGNLREVNDVNACENLEGSENCDKNLESIPVRVKLKAEMDLRGIGCDPRQRYSISLTNSAEDGQSPLQPGKRIESGWFRFSISSQNSA
jgi:hypothetical protein